MTDVLLAFGWAEFVLGVMVGAAGALWYTRPRRD
jgi:hypothetical protein